MQIAPRYAASSMPMHAQNTRGAPTRTLSVRTPSCAPGRPSWVLGGSGGVRPLYVGYRVGYCVLAPRSRVAYMRHGLLGCGDKTSLEGAGCALGVTAPLCTCVV